MTRILRYVPLLCLLIVAGCSPTAAADPTEPPITQEPTSAVVNTIAPTIMAPPTVVATISIDPTGTSVLGATPTPPPTFASATNQYVVQFIPVNDTLNVRDGAGVSNEVVAELVNGDRVVATGAAEVVGADRWLPIQSVDTPSIVGWANAYYLVADDPAIFCTDGRAAAAVQAVQSAVLTHSGEALAALVSPTYGLTLGGVYWSKSIHLSQSEVHGFFGDTASRSWGVNTYSEQPINGTIKDFIVPLLEQNLLPGDVRIACEDSQDTMMPAGFFNGFPTMENLPFYSVMRPGTEGHELEWGAWAFGFVPTDTGVELVYLSHYVWMP